MIINRSKIKLMIAINKPADYAFISGHIEIGNNVGLDPT